MQQWTPRVHLTPAQLGAAGFIIGAALSGAAQALSHMASGDPINWSIVVVSAVTAGLAAWTQSHHSVDPDPPAPPVPTATH